MPRYFDTTPHGTPGVPEAGFMRFFTRIMGPCLRLWYRPELHGTEHLPEQGPYLLAANHSGGGGAEVFCFALVWWEKYGPSRRLAGFAHPVAFHLPLMRTCVRGFGAVPSNYGAADAALGSGVPLLLFPGGDIDAFRPFWQARRVDFGGRRGFLRVAAKHGVPIVPLAITGSHHTVPILWRSRVLPLVLVWPRLLGVKRLPVTLLGAALCVGAFFLGQALSGTALAVFFAWISWTVVPAQFVAFVPSKIRMRVLPPVNPPKDAEDEGDHAEVYDAVTGSIQKALEAEP